MEDTVKKGKKTSAEKQSSETTASSVDYFQDGIVSGGAVYVVNEKLKLTVRLVIRMVDEINADALQQAVRAVEQRFPYLMMQYACSEPHGY